MTCPNTHAGRQIEVDRRVREEAGSRERIADRRAEDLNDQDSAFHSAPIPESHEDRFGKRSTTFARDEDVSARGPFRVGQHAVLFDDQRTTQRDHHQHAEDAARDRQHRDLEVIEIRGAKGSRKISAGIVKTTPAASDSPAEPIVCTMLFSRIVEPPSRLRTEIARTAIGIDALTVSPARSPR